MILNQIILLPILFSYPHMITLIEYCSKSRLVQAQKRDWKRGEKEVKKKKVVW